MNINIKNKNKNINTKQNNNFNKLIINIINNKKGFAIELAILVIIIMSGVVLLITTLMTIQINRSNVSNKQIVCEPIISSYGEDFYEVASNIFIQQNISQVTLKNPLSNQNCLISGSSLSDAIDSYKLYLEEIFYAEPADENSSPSNNILNNDDYLYQPIDDTPYYYSYKIINNNNYNSTSLQLYLHIKTSYLGTYNITNKEYSDEQLSQGLNQNDNIVHQAYRYTSKLVLDIKITRGDSYQVGENTYYKPIVSKWFYDSPMGIGTTNKNNYLPYLLNDTK